MSLQTHLKPTTFELATKIYRRLLSPVGNYRLKYLLQNGLPEPFIEPLYFLFGKGLSEADRKIAQTVENLRQQVCQKETSFKPVSSGLDILRTANETANISSITPEWGMFLYLCAKSFQAEIILELGSSAGISGCYLASASTCKRLTTIDGSPELANLAKQNISQTTKNCTVVNGLFDDVLEDTLASLPGEIDLVYIDGPKEYEPTLRYFKMIIPKLNPGSLVIFDDILWSQEMWRMWQTVCNWQGFSYAINVGRLGLGLWQGSTKPVSVDFSRLLGWLRVGKGY